MSDVKGTQDKNETPQEKPVDMRWEDDFAGEDLTIPYKRTESKDTKNKDDAAEEDEQSEDQKDDDIEIINNELPQQQLTNDPGQYTPNDYSFDVTLANGKTITVKTVEDAEKISEDADNFENPKQLLDFIRKTNKMERQLERDRDQWEAQKAAFDAEQKDLEARNETIEGFAAEFDYLMSKGKLPKIQAKYKDADWSDPEVSKQPGIKEQLAIIDYMAKENDRRAKAKVKPLTSIMDAYYAWKDEESTKQEQASEQAAGEARKAAGARIAGVSPTAAAPYVPKGIAVGNPNVLRRGAAVWDN